MHFSLCQTLAVVSQEPLRSVPNFPEDSVQTDNDKSQKYILHILYKEINWNQYDLKELNTTHLYFCDLEE